jgi:probable phosphoglycerate mutase
MVSPDDESAHRPNAGRPADTGLTRGGGTQVNITVVRHGEPDWTPHGGVSVQDPGLTSLGRAQSRAVCAEVAAAGVDAIYVSPLCRAQETVAPLAEATGIEAVTLGAIAEIEVGATSLSQAQVDRYFVEAMQRPLNEHWDGWPEGETFRAFHERVVKGAADILARHEIVPERMHDFTVWHMPPDLRLSIAVVAHGGTNAVLLTHLLDVRPVPWEWLRFESALASFSVCQARPIGVAGYVWSLQNFNEVDPLRRAGLR